MRVFQHSVLRLFGGTYANEATVASAPLLSELTDQVRRPELIGSQFFCGDYVVVPQGTSFTGPTYPFWGSHVANWETEPVFVVIQSTALVKISGETLSGPSSWILRPTNSPNQGVHAAQFQFQGFIESLTIEVPAIADGGINGVVNMRAFLMPDLVPTYVVGVT